jgi:hypothetical protein
VVVEWLFSVSSHSRECVDARAARKGF